MSKGEEKIASLLHGAGLSFTREKTFSDLKNGLFRFDFYVKDVRGRDCIIEYNGEQHYHFVKKFYKTEKDWRNMQGHDRRKISYCLAKEIPLYIIPFWELSKIQKAEDIFQEKYRARSQWKNELDKEFSPLKRSKNL